MNDKIELIAQLAFELRETLGRGARLVRVENGPPLPQLTVLGHLHRLGTMSMTDLATAERVRPQSMSTTLKALEHDGLIIRRAHPTDGRATILEMTKKGKDTLDQVFAIREDWLHTAILECLTESERDELKRSLRLIQRIVNRRDMA